MRAVRLFFPPPDCFDILPKFNEKPRGPEPVFRRVGFLVSPRVDGRAQEIAETTRNVGSAIALVQPHKFVA
jgi:hypothetical protein